MPHYETPGKEAVALEQFQLLSMSEVIPKIEELMTSTTRLEFDNRIETLRNSDLMRRWLAMMNTFKDAHRVDNMNAASAISEEVRDKFREAVAFKESLAKASAPAAGGKRRKYSRKYCRKTTCKKMGFSQKASCRPYKNCFTRRARK